MNKLSFPSCIPPKNLPAQRRAGRSLSYKWGSPPYHASSSLKDAYSDYTKVTVISADIDNEGGEELLVIYEKNLKAEDTESGEPIAESGIDLYDSSYEKLATLVESKDSFWLDEKVEEQKFFFELDDVEIADIDADGNMEILIRTPFWEALGLSIYKLENGKVKGDIGYSPVLKP